jgi:protein-S-isoprenylcysteine O-methyltransferase Ste14
MAALIRALTYASVFIGLLLVFVPARVLERSGVVRPEVGAVQIVAIVAGAAGGILVLWCVLTFAFAGKGTPAPFDPPRRLVVRGPYRFSRNPMYVGAALVLAGVSLFFESSALAGYTALFLIVVYLFIRLYEEPTLRGTFGEEYEAYCREVGRWLPRRRARSPTDPRARPPAPPA